MHEEGPKKWWQWGPKAGPTTAAVVYVLSGVGIGYGVTRIIDYYQNKELSRPFQEEVNADCVAMLIAADIAVSDLSVSNTGREETYVPLAEVEDLVANMKAACSSSDQSGGEVKKFL
jgi:histidyl-tRNA synthetase